MMQLFSLKNKFKYLIIILLIAIIAGILVIFTMEEKKEFYSGATPWRISTPEAQGFDSEVLVTLLERIKAEELDIHSIILMRNSHVFFEFYAYPFNEKTPQHAMSVGKSFVSTLTGIALAEGAIPNLNIPIIDSFPEIRPSIDDPRKLKITLRQALNMTTGFDIGDDNISALNAIMKNDSWIKGTWEQKMSHEPGEAFNYASFVSHLIAQVTQHAVKEELLGYARKKLLDPIGIGPVQAQRDPQGNWFGAGGLWMTAQDMLRFGMLYLHEGRWGETQVVAENWVKEATKNQIGNLKAKTGGVEHDHYGYQWWVFDNAYAAVGVGGQQIFIIPELDFVAVVTRANPKLDLVSNYFLKALKSPFWPAKENPEAVEKLNNLIKELGQPSTHTHKIQLPKIAHEISGQRYQIPSNTIDPLNAFSFLFDESSEKYLFKVEQEDKIIEYNLGQKGQPSFSDVQGTGERPDGKSQYAAIMEWQTDEQVMLDIYEVGYPTKIRWIIQFSGQQANVSIEFRGAASGITTFTAENK